MESYPLPLLISALTALVASIVGPVVTLSVSRRQFRANVISTNRQKWIDTFRDGLADLLSHFNAAQASKRASTDGWRSGSGPVILDPALGGKLERTYRAIAQIQLLTNGDQPAHQALNEAIGTAMRCLLADQLNEAKLSACLDETTRIGRHIIRDEWRRVKRGV